MKRRAAAASIVLLLTLAGARVFGQQVPAAAETFDKVWTIVRDTAFDKSFNEADWDRIREQLRPKAIAAKTPGELRAVLADMLGRLGLSHFAVIPSTPDAPSEAADLSGQPGFDVRLIKSRLLVTTVDPNRGAAAVGVHPGWIVDTIGGKSVASLIQLVEQNSNDRVAQLEVWRAAQRLLRGPSGSRADVTFINGAGTRVTKSVERSPERGVPVTVGSLPTMYVRVNSAEKETPGGRSVGVIGFNVWMTAVDKPFQMAVDRFRRADGIVIDLRGNPGGLAAMIMGIAGHFVADRATLGVMRTKDSELRFAVNPRLVNAVGERVEPYSGPVAILVDGMTGSASECFAGGMQSLGRARIFGQTSMGQALPALFDKLPNGDVLIHAWGDFVTGTGVRIEGRGVVPDEPAAVSRETLLAGHDAPLEAALRWIDAGAKQ